MDVEMVAETLVPTVFQAVALKYAADPETASLLRRTFAVTLTNGVGTLDDDVLTSCTWGASIANPSDVAMAQTQTLVPYFQDFIAPRDNIQNLLTYWIVKGDNALHVLLPGDVYDPNDGFDGNLEYTGASVPAIPASSGATLNVPSEVLSDLVNGLSLALRGKLGK